MFLGISLAPGSFLTLHGSLYQDVSFFALPLHSFPNLVILFPPVPILHHFPSTVPSSVYPEALIHFLLTGWFLCLRVLLVTSFWEAEDWNMIILCFTSSIYLWVSTFCVIFLGLSYLTQDAFFYFHPFACICHFFYIWVMLHCVNVSHFLCHIFQLRGI